MEDQFFLTVCLNPTIQRTLVFDECLHNEVNRVKDSYLDASGKGVNVTRVLQQMGAKVIHLTHNSEGDGERFLRFCKRDNLKVEAVPSPIQVRTCTTIINTSDESVTELVETGAPVPEETESEIRTRFDKLVRKAHTVIISGTTTPGYSAGLYSDMTRAAKVHDTRVILDIRGEQLLQALEHNPDFIKVNMPEFVQTFIPDKHLKESDSPSELLPEIEEKANEIKAKYGTKVILTMGSRGVISYAEDTPIQSPAFKFTIRNTIGCGDAFTAGFALQYNRDPSDLEKAINIGQKCATANAALIRPGRILS